jgi:hypothetical protein
MLLGATWGHKYLNGYKLEMKRNGMVIFDAGEIYEKNKYLNGFGAQSLFHINHETCGRFMNAKPIQVAPLSLLFYSFIDAGPVVPTKREACLLLLIRISPLIFDFDIIKSLICEKGKYSTIILNLYTDGKLLQRRTC